MRARVWACLAIVAAVGAAEVGGGFETSGSLVEASEGQGPMLFGAHVGLETPSETLPLARDATEMAGVALGDAKGAAAGKAKKAKAAKKTAPQVKKVAPKKVVKKAVKVQKKVSKITGKSQQAIIAKAKAEAKKVEAKTKVMTGAQSAAEESAALQKLEASVRSLHAKASKMKTVLGTQLAADAKANAANGKKALQKELTALGKKQKQGQAALRAAQKKLDLKVKVEKATLSLAQGKGKAGLNQEKGKVLGLKARLSALKTKLSAHTAATAADQAKRSASLAKLQSEADAMHRQLANVQHNLPRLNMLLAKLQGKKAVEALLAAEASKKTAKYAAKANATATERTVMQKRLKKNEASTKRNQKRLVKKEAQARTLKGDVKAAEVQASEGRAALQALKSMKQTLATEKATIAASNKVKLAAAAQERKSKATLRAQVARREAAAAKAAAKAALEAAAAKRKTGTGGKRETAIQTIERQGREAIAAIQAKMKAEAAENAQAVSAIKTEAKKADSKMRSSYDPDWSQKLDGKLKAAWAEKVAAVAAGKDGVANAHAVLEKAVRQASMYVKAQKARALAHATRSEATVVRVTESAANATTALQLACKGRIKAMDANSANELKVEAGLAKGFQSIQAAEKKKTATSVKADAKREAKAVEVEKRAEDAAIAKAKRKATSLEAEKDSTGGLAGKIARIKQETIRKGKEIEATKKGILAARKAAYAEAKAVRKLRREVSKTKRALEQRMVERSYEHTNAVQLVNRRKRAEDDIVAHRKSAKALGAEVKKILASKAAAETALPKAQKLAKALEAQIAALEKNIAGTAASKQVATANLQRARQEAFQGSMANTEAQGFNEARVQVLDKYTKSGKVKATKKAAAAITTKFASESAKVVAKATSAVAKQKNGSKKRGSKRRQKAVKKAASKVTKDFKQKSAKIVAKAKSQAKASKVTKDFKQKSAKIVAKAKAQAKPKGEEEASLGGQEEALVETSDTGSVESEGERMARINLDCSGQCYDSSSAGLPACMSACIARGGESQRLGEAQETLKRTRLQTIAKHCAYSEAAEDLEARRSALLQVGKLTELLQVDASKKDTTPAPGGKPKRGSMMFVQKFDADGKRDPKAYDNTSMECACIRDCKQTDTACIKQCVWEE